MDSASDSLGDYAAALRYYEEALQRFVRCHSTGHVNVAVTYGNMGNVEESLDFFQKSLEYHEKA
jgi:tetratricopeptide (TPR) repeat protein